MGRKRRKLAGAEKAIKEKESKMRQVKKLQNQQTKMAAKKQQKDQVKKIERSRRRKAINQAGGELSSADAPRLQCLDLPRGVLTELCNKMHVKPHKNNGVMKKRLCSRVCSYTVAAEKILADFCPGKSWWRSYEQEKTLMCNRLNWDPSSITNMGEALCAKGVRAIVSALDVLPEIALTKYLMARSGESSKNYKSMRKIQLLNVIMKRYGQDMDMERMQQENSGDEEVELCKSSEIELPNPKPRERANKKRKRDVALRDKVVGKIDGNNSVSEDEGSDVSLNGEQSDRGSDSEDGILNLFRQRAGPQFHKPNNLNTGEDEE